MSGPWPLAVIVVPGSERPCGEGHRRPEALNETWLKGLLGSDGVPQSRRSGRR